MENENIFLWIKAAIVAAAGAYGAAFGWLGWLIAAWLFCMVADWATGSAAAAAKGDWSSAVARAGIWHKGGMIVIVAVSAVADSVIQVIMGNIPMLDISFNTLILPIVLVWYILTELGSIAENAADMGAPVPKCLLKLLEIGKTATENTLDFDGKDGDE